ncbi:C2 calcium-dependent domain-containing protein 4C-like [Mizuhopecten yessoensis]|uniref:Synaptotagmin-3 n=1 Tax=Mizuhopecten yessoensis TaxID=6573 RepID=A0A210QDW6_MIZYE|nr:C2 calcium-dependent domain-containing protein 4C-like [Mizuhopecten yessoensis]OWF46916.1 Synaptotagmin-3 [Mizuhopecten yessoensis]
MESVREWLMHKCKINSFDHSTSGNGTDLNKQHCGALTPNTIPEFVIPKSGDSSRRQSSELESIEEDVPFRGFSPRNSIASSGKNSPGHSPLGSNICLDVPKHTIARSVPASPKHEVRNIVCQGSTHSLTYSDNAEDYSNTHVDPLSFDAMSLPHFRTKTSTYGFTTLTQCPHTRRKESLFHAGSDSLIPYKRTNSFDGLRVRYDKEWPPSYYLSDSKGLAYDNNNTQMPAVIVTPSAATPEMDEETPVTQRSLSAMHLSNSLDVNHSLPYFKSKLKYYRRRSSLLDINDDSDECSDSSTDVKRLSMSALYPFPKESPSLKRHSSPQLRTSKENFEISPLPKPSIAFGDAQCQFLVQYGEIKFAFQYLAKSKQLKVSILRAENLGGHGKNDNNMNAYVKVYLMPGKLQKQTSDIIKHTRCPIFEQEFYFTGLTLEQLHAMTLRIKLFHKGHNLRLPEFVGKVDVNLDSYDLLTENRMWKDLDIKRDKEDLGSIEICLKFQSNDGSIQVTVVQVKGLPHHPITGHPDPYIRVELVQPGRSVSRKTTKTKKNTADPVFNESFVFNMSFKRDDLAGTKLTFSVYDHDRIRSDYVIGQVKFCADALQTSAMEHWIDVFNKPGKEVQRCHELLDHEDDFK